MTVLGLSCAPNLCVDRDVRYQRVLKRRNGRRAKHPLEGRFERLKSYSNKVLKRTFMTTNMTTMGEMTILHLLRGRRKRRQRCGRRGGVSETAKYREFQSLVLPTREIDDERHFVSLCTLFTAVFCVQSPSLLSEYGHEYAPSISVRLSNVEHE